jgi:fatty acid-binding protein DegV
MSRVAVVTDTTGYLPGELVQRNEIQVVSLYVNFGGEKTVREANITDYAQFYEDLRGTDALPTTSQPPVGDFLEIYEPLIEAGHDIISVHISAGLSGTCDAARQAVESLERDGHTGRVRVFDSATGAGGIGIVALAAAKAARAGVESEMTPIERVRTSARAFERMVDYARQRHAAGADGWVVQHIQSPDQAAKLVDAGREIFGSEPVWVSEVGPVLGVHTGPGLLGVGGVPRTLIE